MTHKKLTEEKLLHELNELFGAEHEPYDPAHEIHTFLEERAALEKRDEVWTFDGYLDLYDTLKAYALEDKLMENMEMKIRWAMEDDKEEFLESKFYRRFRDHDIVARAVNDYS